MAAGAPQSPAAQPAGRAGAHDPRGGAGNNEAAGRVTRIPPGHPEGYPEGFANVYSDVAEAITARREGREPDPAAGDYPTVMGGVRGVKFIEAAVEPSRAGGVWVDATVSI